MTGDQGTAAPRGWTVVVAVVCVLTLATVAADSRAVTPTAVAGVAALVLFGAYLLIGRRAFNGGPGWVRMTVVVALVGLVGAAADPSFATVQVVAYPLVWTLAPDARRALLGNIGLAAAVCVGYSISTGDVPAALAVEAVAVAFSIVMGLWVSSIADRSEERRRLVVELTEAQDQLAALHRDAGAAAERERLSRELHDTLAQSLTAIVMLAERAKVQHPDAPLLGVLEETAREALTETRSLVAAAAPVSLAGGLGSAVDRLGARFERETGVVVSAVVTAEVPRGLEVVLLRCAQEGLANIRKHANAAHADLHIERIGDDVRMVLTDDGRGFAGADLDQGFGLAGMRERVALVGGEITLSAGPSGGSVLDVRLPCEQPAVLP